MELVKQVESKPLRNEKGQLLPGHTANPNGLKKGTRHFSTLFREAITKVAEGQAESDDVLIVKRVIGDAKKGNYKAIDVVREEVDGVMPKTDLGEGNTFNIMVVNFADGYSNPSQPEAGQN